MSEYNQVEELSYFNFKRILKLVDFLRNFAYPRQFDIQFGRHIPEGNRRIRKRPRRHLFVRVVAEPRSDQRRRTLDLPLPVVLFVQEYPCSIHIFSARLEQFLR